MLIFILAGLASAADHAEAPNTERDAVADLGDIYAWHHDGTLSLITTFGGYGGAGRYDAEVLYTFLIDNDGDAQADHALSIRFGPSGEDWGVQLTGVPGAEEPLTGPVEEILTAGTTQLWAGESDDPFFFDLTGFEDTLATGTVSFDSTRDSIAGGNVNTIVIDLDLASVQGDGDSLNIWATTGRIGGGR